MIKYLHEAEVPRGITMSQTLNMVKDLKAERRAFTIGFWSPADERGVTVLREHREAEEALNRQHFAQEKGCRCSVS